MNESRLLHVHNSVCFIYARLVMNREERLSRRRELYRLRRERETTEERKERLAMLWDGANLL